MNERIKELLVQSGLLDYTKIIVPEHEKFAELIIKYCADICLRQSRSGWNDDRKAQARLDYDLIKEHFGVEE
jgi:hypothetical protein